MDSAILGGYSSNKLVITEFDIQRSNERSIQASTKRKVVGKHRQNVSISLAGYLICTSFADLEAETDKLLEALNQKTIKLVVGNRPNLYWLVSWSDVDLARKPGNGGYVLPITLSFECLEESAVKGIPAVDGYVKASAEVAVNPRGYRFMPVQVPDMKTLVIGVTPGTSPVTLFSHNAHTAFISNQFGMAVLVYSINGVEKARLSAAIGGKPVTVAVSYEADKVTLYLNTAFITIQASNTWAGYSLDVNPENVIKYAVGLDFVPIPAYVREYLGSTNADDVIKLVDLKKVSNINNPSSVPTPVSVLIAGDSATATLNDFGFRSDVLGEHTFNGIDGKLTSNIMNGISYAIGKKTLLPYLVKGANTAFVTNAIFAYLAWTERHY